jgi:flavin-dependent dehydrogenase
MVDMYVHTLVVGSGPAGFAAAYWAAPAGPVLVIDAHALPRDKSCGGMLHPLALGMLSDIAPLPERLLLEPASVAFRYLDWDRGLTRATDLRFVNVDRAAFDEWLLEQLPDGVEVMGQTRYRTHRQRGDGSVEVIATQGDTSMTIVCEHLVGADGARSSVRGELGVHALERYVTLQDFCVMEGEMPAAFDCFWMDGIPGFGIGYIVPKAGRVLVGMVYYPGTKRAHLLQDQALQELRRRLPIGQSMKREAWVAPRVTQINDVCPGQGRVLLAGEAGGFISPTSGEGISWALLSGRACGSAIALGQPDAALGAYADGVKRLLGDIRRRLLAYPFVNSRWGKTLMGLAPQWLINRATFHL